MADASGITVCVPVFEGERFVENTLTSLKRQTFSNFHALISIDRCDDNSAEICRRFADDRRFEIVTQDQRLGWVDNCNWLLERVRTPYFCILPHDDIILPTYLEAHYREALAHPQASVIYCDIQSFGDSCDLLVQTPIIGDRLERMLVYLKTHYNAVAFRGLVTSEALSAAGLIPGNAYEGFAQDTVWLFALLQCGTFVRLAEPLYRKRYVMQAGVHGPWSKWDLPRKQGAWLDHCLTLATMALDRPLAKQDQALVLDAVIFRLLRRHPDLGPYQEISDLPPGQQADFAWAFITKLSHLFDRDLSAGLADGLAIRKLSTGDDVYGYLAGIIGNRI